ncbi:hypothetical protein [Alteromonas ponticola]|uniref:Uncharacterized protein n=1 Tax=Alteromonas ponticola TaxID=2720613 RepID=A0ABX1QYX2_9ALTE|nr:hypothetical protein [Alteromonas ponticola]NMH59418.1 hypothetical protein [Alteromonas ponticola]
MALLQLPSGTWLAYHMALYHYPHNVQLLYEVSLTESAQRALKGKSTLTILPETFALQQLMQGHTLSLHTTFYEGHFERGGKSLFADEVIFTTQLYYRDLRGQGNHSANAVFDRVAINDHEQLAIHQITGAPSFDSIHLLHQPKTGSKLKCHFKIQEPPVKASMISTLEQCLNSESLYFEWQDFVQ